MSALRKIDPHSLQRRLEAGDVVLIDIRGRGEYAREHIAGSQLVPLPTLGRHDFSAQRKQTAVFTCRSGARTAMAAPQLTACGFRKAYVLDGGIMAWRRAGLPVASLPRRSLLAGLLTLLPWTRKPVAPQPESRS